MPNNLISCDDVADKIYIHSGLTATITSSFSSPASDPSSLTFDGTHLVSCDKTANKIYIHSGLTAAITNSFSSPASDPSGLAFDGTHLVSCDKTADRIYIHSGLTATITSSFSSPASDPSSLTFDGTHLVSCGLNAQTGTFYPAVGGDDGYGLLPAGDFDNTSNPLYIGHLTASRSAFIRFPSVNIPQGATISAAYVKLTAIESESSATINVNCHLNDIDNAAAPTNITEFNNLALTGAIAWNNLPNWVNGVQYNTPSLVSILQNIVDRGGWSSGNAVQLVIKDNGSSEGVHRHISAYEWSSGAEKAELHVEWTFARIYIHSGLTAAITNSFSSPASDPSGLAFDGTHLVSCDKTADRIYIHSGLTAAITNSFSTPTNSPSGLTYETAAC